MQGNEHIPSSLGELREKHLEVFGEETGSYHKEFLRKRIAWRLQAVAEGDLSERARRRAEELANDADLRTRAPRDPATSGSAEVKVRTATDRISPSRDPRLPLPGWTLLYARDTTTGVASLLGFIPADADPRELLGGPLPDGVYEIEVRPSELFWDECRGRKVITLIAESAGGGGSTTGLPVIQNLRREIVSFQSVIRWNVVAEYEPGAFEFGLWFGLALPVDTSPARPTRSCPTSPARESTGPPAVRLRRNTSPSAPSTRPTRAPSPNSSWTETPSPPSARRTSMRFPEVPAPPPQTLDFMPLRAFSS